jgi:hypothetical protein
MLDNLSFPLVPVPPLSRNPDKREPGGGARWPGRKVGSLPPTSYRHRRSNHNNVPCPLRNCITVSHNHNNNHPCSSVCNKRVSRPRFRRNTRERNELRLRRPLEERPHRKTSLHSNRKPTVCHRLSRLIRRIVRSQCTSPRTPLLVWTTYRPLL